MNESDNLPQAISHKKLSFLLNNAKKDMFLGSNDSEIYKDVKKSFLSELESWEEMTKEILKEISTKKDNICEGKDPNSIMAMGAMEVHLNMALQALNCFKNDKSN